MISVLDIGLGILILLFLVRGLLRGLLDEIAGFVGIFLGIFLAGRFYPAIAPQFTGVIESKSWANGLSYALIFGATIIVVALCAIVARRFLAMTMAAWLDNLLGAVIGAAKGLFVVAIILALMQRFTRDSPFLKQSVLAVHIDNLVTFARSLMPPFL